MSEQRGRPEQSGMTEDRSTQATGILQGSVGTGERLSEEQRFVARVKAQLDSSCARVDAATLSRLNAMRHRALEGPGERRQRVLLPFATLASGCALLLVLAINNGPVQPMTGAVPEPSLADIDLLSTQEDLMFYEEYEFIQWLANTSE